METRISKMLAASGRVSLLLRSSLLTISLFWCALAAAQPPEKDSQNDDNQAVMLTQNIDEQPKFMGGGINTFRKWVFKHLKYPEEAVEKNVSGRVAVSFVVRRNGRLTDIDVLETPDPILSDEVVALLEASPEWIPAQKRGRAARSKFILPVQFTIIDNK